MANKYSKLKQNLFCTCLIFLLASTNSHAEIYKWVDENGKTHYSDRKADAGKSKVDELKIETTASESAKPTSPIPNWKKKELELQQRLEKKQLEKQKKHPKVKKAIQAWGGDEPETDVTRCALARDIISGAARLRNGATVDKRDKQLAKSEIRKFCH